MTTDFKQQICLRQEAMVYLCTGTFPLWHEPTGNSGTEHREYDETGRRQSAASKNDEILIFTKNRNKIIIYIEGVH